MKRGKRVSLSDLRTRSEAVFTDGDCQTHIASALRKLPNGAYEEACETVFLRTGNVVLAEKIGRACRSLAMIKRDYGLPAFEATIFKRTSQVPRLISTGERKEVMSTSTTPAEVTEVATPAPAPQKAKEPPAPPKLPLQHLTYRASINGAFARVRCVQTFKNDAMHPIEPVYCFPMPDDSSVIGCKMVIGDRKIDAQLKEKEEAKREYREAVDAGHHGALLEQEESNIFTMNVGGLEPGKEISVDIDYVQRIPWQAGGGRFRIPLVVAPPFIAGNPLDQQPQGHGWSPDTDMVPNASRISPPVAPEGVSYLADITVMFGPGFACELASPSHDAVIERRTVNAQDPIEIKTGDITCDRDFVLVYTSTSAVPEVAQHFCAAAQEYFFQATIMPPGVAPAVPSSVLFVLDISGSMGENGGVKITGLKRITKEVVRLIMQNGAQHTFGILPFNASLQKGLPFGKDIEAADQFIDKLQPYGGTELGPALTRAHKMFAQAGLTNGVIVLVTDGQTTSLQFTGSGVRVNVIGIDTAVNDRVIKDLAYKTGGTHEFVYPGEDYTALASRINGYLSGPVLRDVKVEAREDIEVINLEDVFTGRPAAICARFSKDLTPMVITGTNATGTPVRWELNPREGKECNYLPQIWAREFIRVIPDPGKQKETSLKYGVVCKYTSFVAISKKEVPGQAPVIVPIPVSLPVGWNYDAVFGAASRGSFVPAGLRHRKGMVLGCAPVMDLSADEGFEVAMAGGNTLDSCDDMIAEFTETAIDFSDADLSAVVSLPSNTRFTFDSPNLPDRVVALFIAQGKPEFDAHSAEIRQLLTVGVIHNMTEEERAKTYYFAAQLVLYGMKFDAQVMNALRVKPTTELALGWFNLARRQEGLPFDRVIPAAGDGADYIASQYNSATLCSGDWLLVP